MVCGPLGVFTQQKVHGIGPTHTWWCDGSVLGCARTSAYIVTHTSAHAHTYTHTHTHIGCVPNDPF